MPPSQGKSVLLRITDKVSPPHKLAFPCVSKGMSSTSSPATINSAPLVYTGAAVSRFANIAIIGCKKKSTLEVSTTRNPARRTRLSTHRHDPKDAIRRRRQRVAGAAMRRDERLGRVRVQHRVHDVAREVVRAVPAEQARAVERRRAGVQERAGRRRAQRERAAPAEPLELDEDAAQQRAGHAEHRDDERVAVRDVRAAVAELGAARGLDVGEEGLERVG